jgi:tetratricopeptide (TPR) repeat protein
MLNKQVLLAAALVLMLQFWPLPLYPRENSSELYQKGARLAMEGEIDSSIQIFKKVIDMSPSYCLGHYGLGKAYLYKRGTLADAIRHLESSVKLGRRFSKGYFYLGFAFLLTKKYRNAAHAFKMAYAYDNNYIEALYNLGAVYDSMGKKYESQVYFTKYLNERVKKEEGIIF